MICANMSRRVGRCTSIGACFRQIGTLEDGHGKGDLLQLLIEVSGEARDDKAAKVATARNLWVPAVNNDGQYGRWAFIEISDPWDAKNTIRGFLNGVESEDEAASNEFDA